MPQVVIVVPCFNEADRLPAESFARFAPTMPGLRFVLVDDGSSDATLEALRALERRDPRRFSILDLPHNRGKAEAVRAGMQRAFAEAPDFVGYWDARSTRSALRHYVGRHLRNPGLTDARPSDLRHPVRSEALAERTRDPRTLRRAVSFDLGLRRRAGGATHRRGGAEGRAGARDAIFELPLERWTDTGVSKVRPLDLGRATLDLLRIRQRYLRR